MTWFLLDAFAIWLLCISVIWMFFIAIGRRNREFDRMSERWLHEQKEQTPGHQGTWGCE